MANLWRNKNFVTSCKLLFRQLQAMEMVIFIYAFSELWVLGVFFYDNFFFEFNQSGTEVDLFKVTDDLMI